MKRLAIALVVIALAGSARAQEEQPQGLDRTQLDAPKELPTDLEGLLKLWSAKLGAHLVLDEGIGTTRIEMREPGMNWGAFRKLLEFHDVVLEQKQVEGGWVLFAHHRRNLAARLGPPFRVVDDKDALERREEVVTAFVQVKHGSGNDIFATVRGLLVRDINRVGNILYVRGAEVIILVDFADNVDYYKKCIEQLDREPPTVPLETRILDIRHARAEDLAHVAVGLLSEPGTAPGARVPFRVVPEPRSNRLVLRATHEQLEEVTRILDKLDVPGPTPDAVTPKVPEERRVKVEPLGLVLEEESASIDGVRVVEVAKGSAAEKEELRANDRILALDGEKATTAKELAAKIAKAKGPVTVRVGRGDWRREVTLGAR